MYITVVVDMSEVNRALVSKLNLMFTANYVECLPVTLWFDYATLYNNTADDFGPAYWWAQVKSFFTGLFSGFLVSDSSGADDFADDMESQATQVGDLVDGLTEVTKPDVEDIDLDLSGIVDDDTISSSTSALSVLLSNDLFLNMGFISLTISLIGYVFYGKR